MPVMDPKTWPRGKRPDFTLPAPNPNPTRMTDALWWLVCMRQALEPKNSANGGTFANKRGYHNAGENLPGHKSGGAGKATTDHSIRRAPDRTGPWWLEFTSAHDWTFIDAQRGDYRTISKYTIRLINAMKDPDDIRPDDVYAYTLGQIDNDSVVEGYNEYDDEAEYSADKTHNWHRHDSFRRNIIGNFWKMWQALTIDMGWTMAEWLQSTLPEKEEDVTPEDIDKIADKVVEKLCTLTPFTNGGGVGSKVGNAVWGHGYPANPGSATADNPRVAAYVNLQNVAADQKSTGEKVDQVLDLVTPTPPTE